MRWYNKPLGVCLLGSALAHVALVGWLVGEAASIGGSGVRPSSPPGAILRLVPPIAAQDAPSAQRQGTADPAVASTDTRQSAPESMARRLTLDAPASHARTPTPTGLPPDSSALTVGPVDEVSSYIPRPFLTVPPVLLTTVLLAWPDSPGLADGRYQAVLTLFIDDTGFVRRVVVDDDGLPAPLAEVARAAFIGARFEPGQVQGHIVKSRIRVAVEFESRPTATAKHL